MQDRSALGRALEMVRDLRQRCPWDRVQTRETIRPYLVEEVFELDHAIATGDPTAIREEVADLLLHLAWQLVLGEERGEFTAGDVAADLERKMRRRHPHLFDLGPRERWESLKRREGKLRGVLEGLPPALPSLHLAYRLQERAASVGFDWPDTDGPAAKVREELAETLQALHEAAAVPPPPPAPAETGEPVYPPATAAVTEELGDLLFAVVNLARKARVQPATALDAANRKFRARFEGVERLAQARGIDVTTAGLAVLDGLWDEVKAGR
ncbi:MAG: nucleoside triphosphate pyrophosphohydrolase [Gemmatimonadetes bacterium]|nr:nucleoside triphosphate pyrophosphohydrolase [Gemmatimonadota bacterium]MBP6669168.1 nucleoside triphosphate pyrophosphohydrolase [Gemmatimonadales bacterium]MBK6778792.1 nucleoside triphosphate pyrophosphohydrolase [Gemmatimonadota bacterium]MBK7348897.1 nucleoside triphosphate pyrophosphohydrolase [Gemmatimonadota bacterium]MBK7714460.1 nucleoside triphosphate pyrophosphohydrolase [Gemmatimonadota bacterium]